MKTSLLIIQYGLNILGIIWIFFITELSFGLIVRMPDCSRAMNVIIPQLTKLIPFYLLFLLCITGINFFIERKLEKKSNTKKYIYLLGVQCILILVIAFFVGKVFYDDCCYEPEVPTLRIISETSRDEKFEVIILPSR